MVPLGFYFVHRTTLDCGDVPLQNFRARNTLTTYPHFLRYEVFRAEGLYFVLNARGTLLVLQPLPDVATIDEAQKRYDNAEEFDVAYQHSISTAARRFGFRQQDFDDSSLLWLGAKHTQISWRRTDLALNLENTWQISIFIEALLIFSACKSAESTLVQQLNRPSNVATSDFINAAKDLVFMENPSDTLVNEEEIALLTSFFECWGIGRSVKSLQARFDQVITVLSLHASKVQSDHALALNLLVGCATVLALLSVADPLQKVIGNAISSEALQGGMIAASLLLALAAIMRGRLPWARKRVSVFLVKRAMRQRIGCLDPAPERYSNCAGKQK